MDRPQDYESCYWSSNLHASTIFYGSVAQLVSSNRLLSDGSWVQVPPLLPFFLIGSIAQLAEHITFNDRVAGSFPATPTNCVSLGVMATHGALIPMFPVRIGEGQPSNLLPKRRAGASQSRSLSFIYIEFPSFSFPSCSSDRAASVPFQPEGFPLAEPL